MSTPFYDLASLVVVPSGYKSGKVYAQKPLTTDGQLAFTRASSATRVASNGLIEKVRTNLLLQSETFNNASWGKTSLNVSTDTTANPLNGAVTAETITLTGATTQKYLIQSFTQSGLYNYSIYAKAGTHSLIQLMLGTDPTVFANFNISTGAVTQSANSTASIVAAGNGWYRCSMAYSTTTATDIFLLGIDNGTDGRFSPSSSTGNFIIFGAQLQTGDIATDYIATTTAAVSVGPVSGLPRLDYTNSTCPKLLLEPQRTNLAQYSEQFNNAYWVKSNATITANTTIAPDGTQSADTVVITAGGYIYAEFISYAAVTGQSVTISVFAKSASGELVIFGGATTAGTDVYKIENYGNGWYRHSRVRTFTATATTTLQYLISTNGTHIIWGAQVEGSNSAYVTSYIPTLGASVTRVADAASKTGITSLIGQTAGVMFVEFNKTHAADSAGQILGIISDNATPSSNRIQLVLENNIVYLFAQNSAGLLAFSSNITIANGKNKIAVSYGANGYKFYVNGVQQFSNATTGTPPMQNLHIGSFPTGAAYISDGINQALLFTTQLSNAQMAELTAL